MEAAEAVRAGKISARALVQDALEAIEGRQSELNVFITVCSEEALAAAERVDEKVRSGRRVGRLAGIPVAVKDNISTRGVLTTCASRILSNYRPVYDATVVQRLQAEDAVIVGKANMDEFAMGSSTETSFYGPTRNPFDTSRVPGGSSGGSAVALASRMVLLALGSDTGGSVRCPASFTSTIALKPTYGRVSRYGLIAYANSLEQIGPMARDSLSLALLLGVIAGYDPLDSTCSRRPCESYVDEARRGVEGLRIGVVEEFFGEGTEAEVSSMVRGAIGRLEEAGAVAEPVSLAMLRYALPTYYLIAMSECGSNLARFDGVRYGYRADVTAEDWEELFEATRGEGFGTEVKRRIILGTFALSAGYYDQYYVKAAKVRALIINELREALSRFQMLAGPTMPTTPWRLGEKVENPLSMYLMDVDTVTPNLAGLPAISIPCGLAPGNLPVGLQLMAAPFQESILLRASYALENATRFPEIKP